MGRRGGLAGRAQLLTWSCKRRVASALLDAWSHPGLSSIINRSQGFPPRRIKGGAEVSLSLTAILEAFACGGPRFLVSFAELTRGCPHAWIYL